LSTLYLAKRNPQKRGLKEIINRIYVRKYQGDPILAKRNPQKRGLKVNF